MSESFFAQVYKIVAQIPPGKVAGYGQIARMLGTPRAARTVGWALHSNPDAPTIPCHRVVNVAGRVAPGFAFGGPGEQRKLLEAEGVAFVDEQHVDMQKHQWLPGNQDGK